MEGRHTPHAYTDLPPTKRTSSSAWAKLWLASTSAMVMTLFALSGSPVTRVGWLYVWCGSMR